MSRRFPRIVLALAFLLAASAVATAQRPPQDLHQEPDGHWTAWNPPAEIPPDSEVHVVEDGDTLWDLAEQYYGNPYLWPQLWEQNRWVLDAHWIYPGDPLVVGLEVDAVDDLADLGEGGEGEGREGDGGIGRGPAPPVPLGTESDIYCSGYVGDVDESFGYSIIGSEYEALTVTIDPKKRTAVQGAWGTTSTLKYGLATGDIVYLDGGRAGGLATGQLFTVIEPSRRVRHPADGRVYGRIYRYTGRLRVLSVQEETAMAEIVHSCSEIIVGSVLKPYQPEPVPLKRRSPMRPVNYPTRAERLENAPVILAARDEVVTLGEDHVVFIDRGLADGVAPGDVFTVYRLHSRRSNLPPVVLGEVAVLSVHPRASVAKIISTRYAIYVGDRLEIK